MTKPLVAFFGASKAKSRTFLYSDTLDAARICVENGWRVVTGGGPGLMEAANQGALIGAIQGRTVSAREGNLEISLGYSLGLSSEESLNEFVQEETKCQTVFERLEKFTECDGFIACSGGYGTLLEVFAVIELMELGQMPLKPLILCGKQLKETFMIFSHHAQKDGFIPVDVPRYCRFADNPVAGAHLLITADRG